MDTTSRSILTTAVLGFMLGAASLPAGADAPDAAATTVPQPSVWQHRTGKFTFEGFTTAYTCDGIEGKVADILRFFGARNPKVTASGCPRGPDTLSHMLWVDLEFDTLTAAGADVPSAQVVSAEWTPVQLDARWPFFMSEGDCELIAAMKPIVTANFSYQDLSYESACTPHQVSLVDFRVHGKVLKATREHAG